MVKDWNSTEYFEYGKRLKRKKALRNETIIREIEGEKTLKARSIYRKGDISHTIEVEAEITKSRKATEVKELKSVFRSVEKLETRKVLQIFSLNRGVTFARDVCLESIVREHVVGRVEKKKPIQ